MVIEDYFKIWGRYELVDGVYNVEGSIVLIQNFYKLPFKFGNVSGNFECINNKLTTLEGSPISVGGDFWCNNNKLTSLKGCPISIGGTFYCSINKLTSLKGCPKRVGGNFICDDHLKSSREYRKYLIMKKLRD